MHRLWTKRRCNLFCYATETFIIKKVAILFFLWVAEIFSKRMMNWNFYKWFALTWKMNDKKKLISGENVTNFSGYYCFYNFAYCILRTDITIIMWISIVSFISRFTTCNDNKVSQKILILSNPQKIIENWLKQSFISCMMAFITLINIWSSLLALLMRNKSPVWKIFCWVI